MNYHRFLKRSLYTCLGRITLALFVFISTTTFLLAQNPFSAQTSEPLNEVWRWRHIEGLSGKGVRSMIDDKHGNMWFGLDKGILRYDGYNLTYYKDKPYLKSPVGIIFETRDGRLVAGSESGLLAFANEGWTKIFPQSDSLMGMVTCIRQTPDGSLIAGIQNGVLVVNKKEEISVFTVLSRVNAFREAHPNLKICILPDEILFQRNFGRVDDIFIEDDGRIWIFMSRNNDGKLLKFYPSDTLNCVLHRFDLKEELGGYKLPNRNELIKTRNGELWIINGFYKSGILRNKAGKWELLKLSDKFGGDELHTDIIEISDGSIWIGGLGKLYVFKSGRWNVFTPPNPPIPSSRIILHESRDGQIWIAGIQGDVFRFSYNGNQWLKYNGLNFQFTDQLTREWFIASDGKVVYHQNNNWFAFDNQSGLIDAPVKCISTSKGRIWLAGSHQGVAATAYLKDGKWIVQMHPKLSWGIDPRSVFQDREGSLWFGASVDRQESLGQISGVLQLKNPDETNLIWRHYTNSEGIIQHNVYGIGQSPDGTLWLGGTNLLKLENQRWQSLKGKEYFNEYIDIVHSRKNLWVGSRYYGLFRFNGNEWTQYTNNQGLPSNTIISIYEESPKKVWAITDRDIAWFDGQRWFSDIFTEDFRMPREGGEILVDNSGSIWINRALREWKRRAFPFSITPAKALEDYWAVKYIPDTIPPKTTINVYSEKVDRTGSTLIGWNGTDFWENTPTNQLTYSHRLNQEEWSDFSKETSIVLAKLASGKHTFEVRARDKDLNVEPDPVKVFLTVSPPIWKQAWFIVLVLSFLIVIGLYESRLIRRNIVLSKLNSSLSDANQALETRQSKIERQKETILLQKEELEKKTLTLEEKSTEITKQRDQLKEMVEKVEELSNVKQHFFTNISHEFRTPLTLIMGSIERLLSAQDHSDPNRLNQAYESIQRNSRRILRLINQILEVRQAETGNLELNPISGEIVSFYHEIVSLFNDIAKVQHIDLSFSSQFEKFNVFFDHDKNEKILCNILSNSFKHTPPGGKISVSISSKEDADEKTKTPCSDDLVQDRQQYTIVFEVSDTGKGISQEDLPHIFERFYQAKDKSAPHRFDSTGIGLSYVKDLVSIQDGKINVKSQKGAGTTFTYEIPFLIDQDEISGVQLDKRSPQLSYVSENLRSEVDNLQNIISYFNDHETAASSEDASSKSKTDKLIALIVEDESELRDFIRELLESDFEVIDAKNGAIGYKKAIDYQPDIIITDVMMPEMNGIELCEKLKANFITNHIPVIILTAKHDPQFKFEGYRTGADAYIEKPFSTEYLKIRILNLLKAKEKTREKVIRDLIIQPAEIEVVSEVDKMLRKIQLVLEENISDSDFDVESMSQHFFLSRFHFSRKVKQVTGLSPKEIIDSYRLKRAGQLLQQKIPVAEVAFMVGFDHPNSFSRAFRKYYNTSPTEFSLQKLQNDTNCS